VIAARSLGKSARIFRAGASPSGTRRPCASHDQGANAAGSSIRIEQQLDALNQLPKASQKAVSQVLDAMIAQHAA
jgi:hypothetical protein